MMPRLRQFTEFLWCLVYVNLQRFYDTPFPSFYRHFTEPRLCPITDILKSPVYAVLETLVESRFHRSKGGHFLDLTYIEKNSRRKKERKEEGKNRNRMAHQRPLIARNKILRI